MRTWVVEGREVPSGAVEVGLALVVLLLSTIVVWSRPVSGSTAPAPTQGAVVSTRPSSAHGGSVTLVWRRPAGVGRVEDYDVWVVRGDGQPFARELAPGAATTLVVGDLPLGSTYRFGVAARTVAGLGPTAWSAPVVLPTGGCATGTVCVVADGVSGPVTGDGQGFLHGYAPGASSALIRGLHPRHWRVDDTGTLREAWATGADTQLLLSDLWYRATRGGRGGAQSPWTDWKAYTSWVSATVRSLVQSHRAPGYWDVQNEPGPGYYDPSNPPTAPVLREQFAKADTAIREADPRARVEGPSLASFVREPTSRPDELDMRTFLQYSAANGLHWDALSWHENGPSADDPSELDAILRHVQQMRTLLGEFPGVGTPELAINEYGDPAVAGAPGWEAGYLWALETAQVGLADRSCWNVSAGDVGGETDQCFSGALDGLLDRTGQHPTADYWVAQFYGRQTGSVLETTTTDPTVTALVTEGRHHTVKVLLGRHVSCSALLHGPYCHATRTAAPVPVSIRLPASGEVQVLVQRMPDSPTASAAPAPVTVVQTLEASAHGSVTVSLPAVPDSDAYLVTVSPPGR